MFLVRRVPIAAVALVFLALVAGAKSDPVFNQIQTIVNGLSQISGLQEHHSVPYGTMNKKQLRQFLTRRIHKTVKPDEIAADELTLKMFGYVPQDYNLQQSTMNLLTEQAAAFYDYEKKRLFLVEGTSLPSETTTLAHELSHALADQNFNLGRFMDEKPSTDDENLAHSAVVEGQASWLMLAYNLREAGRPAVPTPEMLQTVAESDRASSDEYPELAEAPLYIRESLLFPYARGISFFQAVFQRMDKQAFAAVFQDPPAASSQILHPERYFAHERPTRPELPPLNGSGGGNEIAEGTVGEFDHEILLRQYAGEGKAADLSPHLRGGQFQIARFGEDSEPVLRYASEWDSPERARQFFQLYSRILTGKWDHCEIARSGEDTLTGLGDNGYFVSHLHGALFTSVEGVRDKRAWQRLITIH